MFNNEPVLLKLGMMKDTINICFHVCVCVCVCACACVCACVRARV